MAATFNWTPIYESVSDNPYLNDFYTDMNRWSFNLQIYFLQKRFQAQRDILSSKKGVIQDRTIYEDSKIFAKNLNEMGQLKDRDFKTYNDFFNIMTGYLKKPDLIIYLKASTDTLLTRIHSRGREYENSIRLDYLTRLNERYEAWIGEYTKGKLLIIDVDDINYEENDDDLSSIVEKIDAEINERFKN